LIDLSFFIYCCFVLFDVVAKNAFPDSSSPLSATVYLMFLTTIALIGGTAFAASKTYSFDIKSKGEINALSGKTRENEISGPRNVSGPNAAKFLGGRTCVPAAVSVHLILLSWHSKHFGGISFVYLQLLNCSRNRVPVLNMGNKYPVCRNNRITYHQF